MGNVITEGLGNNLASRQLIDKAAVVELLQYRMIDHIPVIQKPWHEPSCSWFVCVEIRNTSIGKSPASSTTSDGRPVRRGGRESFDEARAKGFGRDVPADWFTPDVHP